MAKIGWRSLKEHYTRSPRRAFQQFRVGVSFFFLGLVGLYIAQTLMQPSLEQELVVLGSLLVLGGGFIWAMMGHLRLLVGRLIRFFSR